MCVRAHRSAVVFSRCEERAARGLITNTDRHGHVASRGVTAADVRRRRSTATWPLKQHEIQSVIGVPGISAAATLKPGANAEN